MGLSCFPLHILFLIGLNLTFAGDAPPVKIQLFYETYCKYCQEFVSQQLYPTWHDLQDIMDVEMFPFGNAKYASNVETEGWTFKCQHEEYECKANMIHACAKENFKDIGLEMNFVKCLLESPAPADSGPTCAASIGVEWDPIKKCLNSTEGQNLLHEIAVQQDNLETELYFVPWIIVNDNFSLEQTEECKSDLKRIVCEMYTGTTPESCEDHDASVPEDE
ncbi:gamma-interferon-inducible lysosomal thiol reductase-like isoform X1 [Macrobrachium rosenbergii]|uniref:gamma-interferon-inducible lysosomal thiol reductase-like isoform X1 n=2 Tax=Macrobrachium rosenbergii TaxID=79674 RepID=UPI0034D6366B